MTLPLRLPPVRLTVVMTHPVQYFSPWFRSIHESEPRLALSPGPDGFAFTAASTSAMFL